MTDYEFFVAHLRFVAGKMDRSTPEIAAMAAGLTQVADDIEETGRLTVAGDQLRVTARGLAGLAGFLQDRILPEAVAARNKAGERQVRWVIDTSMALMATLMTRAETEASLEPVTLDLPPPPSVPK
jgi:hypothetical protein